MPPTHAIVFHTSNLVDTHTHMYMHTHIYHSNYKHPKHWEQMISQSYIYIMYNMSKHKCDCQCSCHGDCLLLHYIADVGAHALLVDFPHTGAEES